MLRRFAHYEILGPLGRGGMGVVFRARDTRLRRLVALKLLPANLAADPQRRRRLWREARAAAALNHPRIATVYDVGESEIRDLSWISGDAGRVGAEEAGAAITVPYIAMELVEGRTLREELEGGPVPAARVVEIGRDIASGLSAAHDKGVVHRDLKPSNVMLTADGRAKILDFGLARLQADEAREAPTLLTQEGTILGTPPYLAPEQLEGSGVDSRSDLHALGVVLYELLAGRAPYPRRLLDYVKALPGGPAPLPAVSPQVDSGLEAIVSRLLAREPQERFSSAGETLEALSALDLEGLAGEELAGERLGQAALHAVAPDAAAPPEGSGRRRKTLWAAGGAAVVVGLALVLAADWFGWRWHLSDRPVPPVRLGEFSTSVDRGDSEDLVAALPELLTDQLGRVPAANPLSVERDAPELTVRVDRRGDRVVVVIDSRAAGEDAPWSRTVEVARSDLQRLPPAASLAILQSLGVPLSGRERRTLERPPTSSAEAMNLYIQATPSLLHDEEPELHKARKALLEATRLDPGFGRAWAALSQASLRLAHRSRDREEEEFEREAQAAADRAERLLGDTPQALVAQARLLARNGALERAIPKLEVAAWRHPGAAAVHRELAISYKAAGRFCRAVESARLAVEVEPEDWRNWNELGAAAWRSGDTELAATAFREAAQREPAGRNRTLTNLVALLYRMGAVDEMIVRIREVPRESRTFGLESNLAAAELASGDLKAAETSARRAVDLAADHRSNRAVGLLNLGNILAAAGDRFGANDSYRQALDLIDAVDDDKGPSDDRRLRTAYLHALLGECFTARVRAREIQSEILASINKHYNLARIAALCIEPGAERRRETLDELRQAVEHGLPGEQLRREPELSWLAGDPEFQQLTRSSPSPLPCP